MQYSINDTARILGVSPNTVRRRLTSGLIHGEKVGGQWLIQMPDAPEGPPELALARPTNDALVEELRARIANADDRITFLEGHISQLTNALSAAPAEHKPPWFMFWK